MVNLQGVLWTGRRDGGTSYASLPVVWVARQTDATGLGLRVRRLAGLKLIGTRP
jgi:hypothetical protein